MSFFTLRLDCLRQRGAHIRRLPGLTWGNRADTPVSGTNKPYAPAFSMLTPVTAERVLGLPQTTADDVRIGGLVVLWAERAEQESSSGPRVPSRSA